MTRILSITVFAIAAIAAAGTAAADPRDRYRDDRGYDDRYEDGYYDDGYYDNGHGAGYDWARVVDVAPIIAESRQPVRREQCWDEPVRERYVYEDYRRPRGSAGPVLGAIIGGVVGNQFGSGSGKVAMTVAGAALGNAIARDSQRYDGYGYERYPAHERVAYAERCRTVTDYVRDERVLGYDVTYRYHGQTYRTRTDHHPGDRIRVRVDVTPAE